MNKRLFLFFVLFAGCVSFGNDPSGVDFRSSNHSGNAFVNAVDTHTGMRKDAFLTVVGEWMFGDQIRRPESPIETVEKDAADYGFEPESGLRVTWFGHSTILVEIDGYVVLTDPIWSDISPPGISAMPRFFETPMSIDDLPAIDAVIISHDHYDHLDFETIVVLAERGVTFVVPLGVGSHLRSWEISDEQIVELDWWQSWQTTELVLTATPARHFSGRGLNQNKTLWASWSIRGPEHRVFFGGDTGMTPQFEEIGEREGPFDITLMPIGAYNPSWADIHLNPEEAVTAHKMVRGGLMLPIHWGTFQLAIHDWNEPAERMASAARDAEVAFAIPKPGESVDIATPIPTVRWW